MASLLKKWMMKILGMPSCQEIEQFSYDFLEGRLDAPVAKKFQRHLNGCDNCEKFVKTYQEVARPERLKQKIPLDSEFEDRVIQFLKKNYS